MDERNGAKPQRLAIYSPSAAADLAINHTETALCWGMEQADQYATLLQQAAQVVDQLDGHRQRQAVALLAAR